MEEEITYKKIIDFIKRELENECPNCRILIKEMLIKYLLNENNQNS